MIELQHLAPDIDPRQRRHLLTYTWILYVVFTVSLLIASGATYAMSKRAVEPFQSILAMANAGLILVILFLTLVLYMIIRLTRASIDNWEAQQHEND